MYFCNDCYNQVDINYHYEKHTGIFHSNMIRVWHCFFTVGYCMVYLIKFNKIKITTHGSVDHMPMRSINFLPTNMKMQKKCFL